MSKKILTEEQKINKALWNIEHRKRRPDKVLEWKERAAKRYKINKEKVINAYGSKCVCCGEDRKEFLTVDHIKSIGKKEKKKNGMDSATSLYRWLVNNSFPLDFQLLCWNCNCGKRCNDYCPHNSNYKLELNNVHSRFNYKLKLEIISNYGNSCQCCGETIVRFLTIDHIDGKGNKHRREIGQNGTGFHKWLRKNGFPKDNLRLLCYNCNCSRGSCGYCPHERELK